MSAVMGYRKVARQGCVLGVVALVALGGACERSDEPAAPASAEPPPYASSGATVALQGASPGESAEYEAEETGDLERRFAGSAEPVARAEAAAPLDLMDRASAMRSVVVRESAQAPARSRARPTNGLGPRGSGGSASAAADSAPSFAASRRAMPTPRPQPPALPQSGVLASTFVAGNGVRARLDDLLDRGVMLGNENVRLEAFAERDPLPYPRPATEGMAMFAELERERLDSARDRVHLQIALLGHQGELPRRPPMDVRLVLDRSGSMHGDKWRHAIAAAHAVVDALGPSDRFTLVSYASDATLDLAPTRRGDGRAAHAAIDRLVVGGGTNLEGGLRAAARPRASRDAVGLVLLVSDGQATIGQTAARELASISRSLFDDHGVLTSAIGLGTDFDEQTMLSIAREGSGSYHFVRRPNDIETILEDELLARAQAVTQALRVRIELGKGVIARQVYGSRLLGDDEHAAVRATEVATDRRVARELGIAANRAREEERGLRVHLPTFRRGDQHVILMELEVPAGTHATHVAKVTLDYKDLLRGRNATIARDVRADRTDAGAAQASVVRNVKRTVLAFQAGEALQRAASALQRGDAAAAGREIAERRELLEAASRLWRDPALEQDAILLARYERVIGAGVLADHATRHTLAMAMSYYGDRRMR